ncbi:exonuclease domain-containing protein [Streptomyces sp. NPDC002067]
MSWHTGRLAGFDLETTGTDPETARIVTASVIQCGGGQGTAPATWIADPGVDIPAEAAAIHGYTTDRARAEGRPASEVVEEVAAALAQTFSDGVPVVAMNARYDFTVLDRECRRHGVPTLLDRYAGSGVWPVIDPYVIDKHVDRYRRGSRKLTALCEHYRVPLDGAHDSAADALAAARVAWRLGSTRPELAAMDLETLHQAQIERAAEQAASLEEYFRRKDPHAVVERAWPLIPHQREGQ